MSADLEPSSSVKRSNSYRIALRKSGVPKEYFEQEQQRQNESMEMKREEDQETNEAGLLLEQKNATVNGELDTSKLKKKMKKKKQMNKNRKNMSNDESGDSVTATLNGTLDDDDDDDNDGHHQENGTENRQKRGTNNNNNNEDDQQSDHHFTVEIQTGNNAEHPGQHREQIVKYARGGEPKSSNEKSTDVAIEKQPQKQQFHSNGRQDIDGEPMEMVGWTDCRWWKHAFCLICCCNYCCTCCKERCIPKARSEFV